MKADPTLTTAILTPPENLSSYESTCTFVTSSLPCIRPANSRLLVIWRCYNNDRHTLHWPLAADNCLRCNLKDHTNLTRAAILGRRVKIAAAVEDDAAGGVDASPAREARQRPAAVRRCEPENLR